jgi:2,5-diketo-D-gluconate reductase A
VPEHAPLVTLRDGTRLPSLGLGTWPLDDLDATTAVGMGLELGYRYVDTAAKYGNEVGVGLALTLSGLQRDEFAVSTKLDGGYRGGTRTIASLMASLDRLGLDYVDLLLIHYPLPSHPNFVSTWEAMIEIRAMGLARSIGVMRFDSEHVATLVEATGVVPSVNLARAAEGRGDLVRSVFTHGSELLAHPLVSALAAQYSKTAAQIALRASTQVNLVTLVRSTDPDHLAQNLAIFDFELSAEELVAVAGLMHVPRSQLASE